MARTLRFLAGIPVSELRGCGTKLEGRLHEMGILTVLDLLEHYPRRYLDRRKRALIAELALGEEATVIAEVTKVSGRRTRNRRALVEATVYDGASYLDVTFFNQAWRERQLQPGTEAAFFGKLDSYRGRRRMTNPVVDVFRRADDDDAGQLGAKTGVIVPVYPQSPKAQVDTWQIQRLVNEALERAKEFADPVTEPVLDAHDLVGRTGAYFGIHRPETDDEWKGATRRLVFDEFLRMQLGLVARKRALERDRLGIRHVVEGALVDNFHARLPFDLTGDQRSAIGEILADMAGPAPTHRLLQGDVGSGKTVVAVTALLAAVQGGHQGALMAPTAVLAEQHFLSISRMIDGLTVASEGTLMGDRPVRLELLTNRTTTTRRRQLEAELAQGLVDLVVGTHALLYGELPFASLGAVVVDEQHRFGVEQRALLRGRGEEPDVLVMTATPIPRTAAMLVYGDLDRSELREMPPGRIPIHTELASGDRSRSAAYDRLRHEVGEGRQGYVVCPLVEGSDKLEAKAATEEYERLSGAELADLRVGLLHGQMPARDKEAVMDAFRSGELDVLVATTVIEVGVDVPNATVMIVEDADRFGLAQLHQLRGRVGRGGGAAWCYLVAEPGTPEAEARMTAMVDSTDGFLLAERDLEIRGAGEVFGERQSGFSDLKLGRLPRDEPVVLETRAEAEAILDADPHLSHHRQLAEEVEDLLGDAVEFLFKS
ncbi:MAG: ATP-dependent DNA helicase RecG [Actinobacteria bacterium]|nr:ATP-dependent DNA helicase RecG [Actinomycetota bacterium]